MSYSIMSSATVSPAYGRDYKSKAAAEKDFRDGKDFLVHNVDGRMTPRIVPCSIRDMAPGVKVELRYKRMESLTFVTV